MIRTEKLLKIYGKGELALTALKNIDLEIKSGEFVAVIGPSGAGKSTLLYQLSLLDEPTSGIVQINGQKIDGLSQQQKTSLRLQKLGFVFQDYALLPELNSVENVALPLMMQGFSYSVAEHKARQALARINLDDKMHNLPSQLSGGQQQRVAIARAIAHEPVIIFADEPTANLDSRNGQQVMETFLELNKEGQTIVMVTHEEEYWRHAKRVVSLRDGEVVMDQIQ